MATCADRTNITKPLLKPPLLLATLIMGSLIISCENYPHHMYTWWKAPNWTPDGRIVFLEQYYEYGRTCGGFGDEYTVSEVRMCFINRDGSDYEVITPDPIGRHPVSTAASDDKLLACVIGEGTIYQMLLFDYDGNLIKDLGQGIHPDFSPDGKRIVYQKYSGDTPQGIWIMDIETGEERCLVSDEGANSPSWSPSGNFIAIFNSGLQILDTLGNLAFDSLPLIGSPYWSWITDSMLVGARGGQVLILHTYEGTLDTLSIEGSGPRWSPDGNWFIVYTIHNDITGYFVVNREGSVWIPLQP